MLRRRYATAFDVSVSHRDIARAEAPPAVEEPAA
jgi:hypothetical protein